MAHDYYATLGVGRDATTEQIKKAFRRVARETHPDAHPHDPLSEARFREAAEAYEVLADPDRRRRYDRGDTIDLTDLLGGLGGMDDLLRSVFGEGGLFGARTARATRGQDVLVRTEVTLEEAAFGTEVSVEYKARVMCRRCAGDGAEPGSSLITCPECGGAGQIRVAQRSLFGTMMTLSGCVRCGGEGRAIDWPCEACGGSGTEADEVRVKVEVPAGITSGTRLRLSGRGDSGGRRGLAGDLYVEVEVLPDSRFERRDTDLWHKLSIGVPEAALGTKVEIPLIEGGTHPLEIAPGTQPGEVLRIGGSGMSRLGRRGRGDLLVLVDVVIPSEVSAEEESLLRRLAELRSEGIDRSNM